MTRRKQVSEKSLELNVCAEMLQCLRKKPGHRKALWVGLTQREERQEGLDEKIRNSPGVALMLQFKSPWATSYGNDLYQFSINKKQHEALERLQCPTSVYYVFPLYRKWCKVDKYAPLLLNDTWLVPAACIPSSKLVRESTRIDVMRDANSEISVIGDSCWEATCKAIKAADHFQMDVVNPTDFRTGGIRNAQLEEFIDDLERSGLRFRNLGIFYFPD